MRAWPFAVTAIVAVVAFGCGTDRDATLAGAMAAGKSPGEVHRNRVERGEYLVLLGHCNDCHTPLVMGPEGPESDMTRRLSGHPEDFVLPTPNTPAADSPWNWLGAATSTAFAGPWGVSYATNLTPDENTGIGIWSEELFIDTIRSGQHWSVARPILPPMPWQNLAKMTDEDLRSVYAYLRSIEPISNRVPDSIPAPPPNAPVPAS